jgi:expansin (peptidoglycan-binding protein)
MFFSTVAVTAFAALAAATPVKRGFGGRATFYATGLGACGDVNVDSDYIVALNSAQYGSGYPGPECGKQIQISANGKTATATIKDECPTCNYGDLDMSPSLFNHFSTPDAGVFQMTWDYVGGGEQASRRHWV